MDIKQYAIGKGVDLSQEKEVENAKHIYIEPNNLYSLREHLKPESLNFLFINDINATKFYRILIKEMLIYCKVNGNIIIKLTDNKMLKFNQLIEEVKLCMYDKGEIIENDNENQTIVIKKTKPFLKKNDSITKWTFGIITNGKKNDWVEKQIQSIKAQKIPHYEIIVCGKYIKRNEKNFKYVFFKKYDTGWITGQKNKLVENAKYENLMVLHDRIVLDKEWYKGMKKYGNYFEVLSCKVYNDQGERCGDWITYGNVFGMFGRIGLLDHKDWDKNGYIDGALYILKKSIWRKVRWDETLFWNQGEDAKLSSDWYKKGIVTRFNPFSSCLTLSWRHGVLPLYEFNNQKLSKYPGKYNLISRIKFYIKKILNYLS
ncbi:hypothetical protein HYW74_02890 [Candidatus Pacearchaeota archaeon]|nr:hypothetical protein [Candidatus Pacearchaeota archaeon]